MSIKYGDKMYVDYAGKKLYITDKFTGETHAAEVYLAILGGSQMTYVEASMSQKKDDFISSTENVPIGESLRFYAALKILGREVELVQIEGSDHPVVKHSRRIEWHNTIMAWFSRWLKDSPARWDELYPLKNY